MSGFGMAEVKCEGGWAIPYGVQRGDVRTFLLKWLLLFGHNEVSVTELCTHFTSEEIPHYSSVHMFIESRGKLRLNKSAKRYLEAAP